MKKKTVKELYKDAAQEEWERLKRDAFHSLEFETTLRFLKRYLPDKGLILDAGGGPGRYTIELAKLGYEMVLLDLTPELLKIAKKQIGETGVKDKVKSIVEGSIIDLSQFKGNYFDGVLCLGGPLSHVSEEDNRKKALSELVRVAKKNAPIFVSVMGRLGVLMDCILYWPKEIETTKHFREIWQDGEDYIWRGSSYCHYFLPEEFEQLLGSRGDVEILERVGLEGLAHAVEKANKLAESSPRAWKNWLESHYALCAHPAVFATSPHMLIAARKK